MSSAECRQLTLADPDDPQLRNIAMVEDTYTILLSGEDTVGRFAVIDMLVPGGGGGGGGGGGPPPHRHDFEEAFHVLEGGAASHVRDRTWTVPTGATANVPANAPHAFSNTTDRPVRMLCTVSPAGLEEFFAQVGDEVATRTSPAPEIDLMLPNVS